MIPARRETLRFSSSVLSFSLLSRQASQLSPLLRSDGGLDFLVKSGRMNRTLVVVFAAALAFSCTGEKERADARAAKTAPPAAPEPRITGASAGEPAGAQLPSADYESAMDWYRTAKAFRFTLTEGSTTVEGEMVRPAIGAERIRFKGRDGEWLGSAKRSGLVWYRNDKGHWVKDAATPTYADLVYQRVTFTFDPQKKETTPSSLGAESLGGEACEHYRFTNANSGEVHDVWVSRRDGRVARISIAGERRTTLTITPSTSAESVADP